MRVAVIHEETGRVVNVVLVPKDWTGESGWQPLKGHIAVISEKANIDDLWDGEQFYRPELVRRGWWLWKREDIELKEVGQ